MSTPAQRRVARGIGKNVLRLRKEQRLSQEALARLVHVSRQTILSIEKGAYAPSWPTIEGIADALGVEIFELLPDRSFFLASQPGPDSI